MTATTLSPTADSPEINSDDDLELLKVPPGELIIGSNVRIDPKVKDDLDLLDSVGRRGVRTPISAYRDADGRIVVLRGQRRTLAAVLTSRPWVPVVVEPEPSAADRLADQVMENDQRTGLATADHVSAYEQMAALGLSAEEIAGMTATPAPKVQAGLKAAGSKVARAVVEELPETDIFQAAALEEFADDEQVVAKLKACITEGRGFDHWANHYRDERLQAVEKAAAEQELRDSGVTVLADRPPYDHPKTKDLDYLKHGKRNLTPGLHAKCAGRAVVVTARYEDVDGERTRVWKPVEYCQDWKKYGHTLHSWVSSSAAKADLTPAEKAEATAERRRVIRFNALWRSATSLRHAYLVDMLGRKKLPKGAGGILAAAHTLDRDKLSWSLQRGSRHAHKLLGLKKDEWHVNEKLKNAAVGASDDRAAVIALGMVLSAYEDGADEHAWNVVQGGVQRYLRFLQECGYELSDVERVAAGLTTIKAVEAAEAKAGVPAK